MKLYINRLSKTNVCVSLNTYKPEIMLFFYHHCHNVAHHSAVQALDQFVCVYDEGIPDPVLTPLHIFVLSCSK